MLFMEKDKIKHKNKSLDQLSNSVFDRDAKMMMANLLHNLPGLAYRCKNDKDWTMLFMSERCHDLTGYHPQELMHNNVLSYDSLIVPEDREMVRKTIDEGVASGNQFQIEYRIKHKSGKIVWVMETGCAFYDEEGNPEILDGFIRDISQRRVKDEQLSSLVRELAELNASKDRFFTLLAHDLQNPIYAVISLSEFMMDNCEELEINDVHSAFRQVNNSARTIHVLLENLLDWSRFQTGKVVLQKEYISLKQLIEYAVRQFDVSAQQKNVEIILEMDKDIRIYSDMRLISVIIRNLVSNAIKFSVENSQVHIVVAAKNDKVEISVSDHGVGIPRKYLKRIFSLNSELRQYGTANESGSGLGLILSSNFARLIGAELKVESKLNSGSQFTLILPLKID